MTHADAIWAHLKAITFLENKDPVYAIESFLLSRRAGAPPEESVLQWLEKCLKGWHDGQGKKTLDSIMELHSGVSRKSRFRKLLLNQRDEMAVLDIARLKHLGARIEDAAEMVCERLKKEKWDHTLWEDLPGLSVTTLVGKYKKSPMRKYWRDEWKARGLNWSGDEVGRYLDLFPVTAPALKELKRNPQPR